MTSNTRAKISTKAFKQHLMTYGPSFKDSPDTWAGDESAKTKVGDVYVIFMPAREGLLESDQPFDLELEGVALVYREDGGFPMNYYLDEKTYEMSFMEGVLSSKASDAKDANKAFYCLHTGLRNPTKEQLSALNGMAKAFGGSGERKGAEVSDPVLFLFNCLGIEVTPALKRQPVSLEEFCLALWDSASLPPSTEMPKLGRYFNSAVDIIAEPAPAVAATAPEAVPTAPSQAAPSSKADPNGSSDPFGIISPKSSSSSSDALDSKGDPFASNSDPFATLAPKKEDPFASSSDPFATLAPKKEDPFATPTAPQKGSDPFASSSDPFASTSSKGDPFGKDPFASTGTNPFGRMTSSPKEDPFGPSTNPFATTGSSAKGDAFGSGSNPFGTSSKEDTFTTDSNPFEAIGSGAKADPFASPARENPFTMSSEAAEPPPKAPPSSPEPHAGESTVSDSKTEPVKETIAPPPKADDLSDPFSSLKSDPFASSDPFATGGTKESAIPDSDPFALLVSNGSPQDRGPLSDDPFDSIISKEKSVETPPPSSPRTSEPVEEKPLSPPESEPVDAIPLAQPESAEPENAIPLTPPKSEPVDAIPLTPPKSEPVDAIPLTPPKSEPMDAIPLTPPKSEPMDAIPLTPPKSEPVDAIPLTPPKSEPVDAIPLAPPESAEPENAIPLAPPELDNRHEDVTPSKPPHEQLVSADERTAPRTSEGAPIRTDDNTPVEPAGGTFKEYAKPVKSVDSFDSLDDLFGVGGSIGSKESSVGASGLSSTDSEEGKLTTIALPVEPVSNKDPFASLEPAAPLSSKDPFASVEPIETQPGKDPFASDAPAEPPSRKDPFASDAPVEPQPYRDSFSSEAPVEPQPHRDSFSSDAPVEPQPHRDSFASDAPVEPPLSKDPFASDAPVEPPLSKDPFVSDEPSESSLRQDPFASDELPAKDPFDFAVPPEPQANKDPFASAITGEPLPEKDPFAFTATAESASGKDPFALAASSEPTSSKDPFLSGAPDLSESSRIDSVAERDLSEKPVESQPVSVPEKPVESQPDITPEKPVESQPAIAPPPPNLFGKLEELGYTIVLKPDGTPELVPTKLASSPAEVSTTQAPKSAEVTPPLQTTLETAVPASPTQEKPVFTEPAAPASPTQEKPVLTEPAAPVSPTQEKPVLTEPATPASPTQEKPVLTEPATPASPTQEKPVLTEPADPASPTQERPVLTEPAQPAASRFAESTTAFSEEPLDKERRRPVRKRDTAIEEDEQDRHPVKRTMSLQETLKKLDDQKQKAHAKIEEFKLLHESTCARGSANLQPQIAEFEKDFTRRLKDARKSIMSKLRRLSIEADQRISTVVEEGRGRIEQSLKPALAEIQAIADESRVKKAFSELQYDSDRFLSDYTSRLSNLRERDLAQALSRQTEEEFARIQPLLGRKFEEQEKACELAIEQIRSCSTAAMSDLDTVVSTMFDKLLRIKELDLQKLAARKVRMSDALDQLDRKTLDCLNRLCEQELVDKILPYKNELKRSIQVTARDAAGALFEKLHFHSQELINKFHKVANQNKASMASFGEQLSELKSTFERDGQEQVDQVLSTLSAHLYKRLNEYKELVRRFTDEDDEKEGTPEKRLQRRVTEVKESNLSTIKLLAEAQQAERKNQITAALASFESQFDSSSKVGVAELASEVAKFAARRQEAKRKLEEKLEKLTQKAESISAELL